MSYYGTHNRLARIALEKVENDNYLNGLDRTQWYKIPNLNHLADLKHKFLELNEDDETTSFINDCFAKSEYFFTQLFHSVVMSVLKWVMAITSINGLLQRGSMFVFSEQQFSQLIDFPTSYGGVKLKSLLDLGAGDGAVTSRMAPFFENVYATEMSYTMQWRLQQKGFKLLDVNDWDKVIDTNPESPEDSASSNEAIKSPQDYNNASIIDIEHSTSSPHLKYDVISCLNLLDRCDKPISTLRKIKRTLNPNGLLIVALVLPFKPYVEYNKSNRPDEPLFEFYDFENRKEITVAETYADKLDCVDDDMSCGVKTVKMGKIPSQIDYLIEQVFKPVGFELVRFSKLPYLCEGNLYQSFFYMFDYVFVFKSV